MAGKPNPPKQYAKETTGRPTKFTPERRASIIKAISRCAPYAIAAEANGIVESTLYDWLALGLRHQADGIESDFAIFSQSIKNVEMERMLELSDSIRTCPERWQAHAWLLERRWYKHYGSNSQLNELNNRLDKLEHGELKNEKGNGQERSQKDD